MRKPLIDISLCKKRREVLREDFNEAALILAAAPEDSSRCSSYRQDSHFFALTGFEEPDSIFLFRPGKNPESILFVRPKDTTRETWDGYRFGPEGAISEFAMDEAHPIEDFPKVAKELLAEVHSIYYPLGRNHVVDQLVLSVLKKVQQRKENRGAGLKTIIDPEESLGERRLKKDDYGISMMTKVTQITSEAHVKLMRAIKPGVTERAMQGLFLKEILDRGAAREAYPSIVASGNNATTLHYVFNDTVMEDGALLLVDAGAEYNFFSGDVTRTYPVNGSFSNAQRRIYEKVLKVQKELIALVKPGVPFEIFQTQAVEKLVDVMLSEKLLQGKAEELIESGEYKKYYPHGAGHWLGMDVHDVGLYNLNSESRPLVSGMCFTIEPGLYIPLHDSTVPKELRGIGIRIEDDILVTEEGYLNLTESCPKEVHELENLVNNY